MRIPNKNLTHKFYLHTQNVPCLLSIHSVWVIYLNWFTNSDYVIFPEAHAFSRVKLNLHTSRNRRNYKYRLFCKTLPFVLQMRGLWTWFLLTHVIDSTRKVTEWFWFSSLHVLERVQTISRNNFDCSELMQDFIGACNSLFRLLRYNFVCVFAPVLRRSE